MKKLMTEWRNFINEQSAGLAHDSKYEDSLRMNNTLIDYCKKFPTKCTPEKVKKMLDKAGVEPVLDGVKELLGMKIEPKEMTAMDLEVIDKLVAVNPIFMSKILEDYPVDVLKKYQEHINNLFDAGKGHMGLSNLAKEIEFQLMSPEDRKALQRAQSRVAGKTYTDYGKTSVGMYKEK